MAEASIRRESKSIPVTLGSATSQATTLLVDGFAGGAVDMGTLSTAATSLQVWASAVIDGTYRRLCRADGTFADITLAPSTTDGRVYPLPDEVFACRNVKLIVPAATGVSAVVTLKS